MSHHRPRIVVVGAGIIGSTIAYNLASSGADILLLDKGAAPGSGVTGKAFGWINVINGTPGDRSYSLWREGVAVYRHLKAALPVAFSSARSGSLLWKATAEDTQLFGEIHQNAGEDVVLLQRDVLQALEPRLRQAPDLAVFSPDDLAVNPAELCRDLVNAAIAAGAATRFHANVSAIETSNSRVAGIRTDDETILADVVVIAAGAGTNMLAEPLGIHTGLATSPALLLRYTCSAPVISHILRGPRLEIRQARDNTLLVAKSYVETGDDSSPEVIGEQVLSVMRDELDLPGDVSLLSADIGYRPMFPDDLPRLGFLPEIDGLYLAVGHPGVILAPLIGCLTAEEILGGQRSHLLANH